MTNIHPHYWIISMMWLLVNALLLNHYGIRQLFDAQGYIIAADYLVDYHGVEDTRHFFYSTYIFFAAVLRFAFPERLEPVIIAQIIISLVAAISLYKSAYKLFSTRMTGLFASLIFLLWIDNMHWNTITMTESLFRSLAVIFIYFLVNFENKSRLFWPTLFCATLILFTRPTGIVIVVAFVAFIFFLFANKIPKPAVSAIILIGVLGSFVAANFMMIHFNFIPSYSTGNIITYMNHLEGTSNYDATLRIIPDQLNFMNEGAPPLFQVLYFVTHNFEYFLSLALAKLYYLLSGYRPYYSTLHNALNIFFIVPFYLFAIVGFFINKSKPLSAYVLTALIVNCGIIVLSAVDWDNRFYLPMEAGLILMASGGLGWLWNSNAIRKYLGSILVFKRS